MTAIAHVHARQLLDSRGNPLEVDVARLRRVRARPCPRRLDRRARGRGAPRRRRACVSGQGRLKAAANVNGEIAAALAGFDADDQRGLDSRLIELDGTPNKGRLGANAILGCSLASAKAAAADADLPLYRWIGGTDARTLPVPLMNVINGGAHAQNRLDLQEFMVVPAGASTFSDALRIGTEVFHPEGGPPRMGPRDRRRRRGGFAPDLESTEKALDAIIEAAERAGHAERVAIALDPAASELFRGGNYELAGEDRILEPDAMIAFYASLVDRFPLVSIEDGLDENAWSDWKTLTDALGDRVQLVGDDLFVTNVEFLRRGIEQAVATRFS